MAILVILEFKKVREIVRGLSLEKEEEFLKNDSEEKETKSELIIANNVKGILDISIYKLYIINKKTKTVYYIKIRITYRKLFRLYIDLKRPYNLFY